MIETKAAKDMQDADVQAKKAAAEKYCKHATEYTSAHGGKPWKYLLIPHHEVSKTVGLNYLISLGY
jgi:type III restriction enzyme